MPLAWNWLRWCWKFRAVVPWACRVIQHPEDETPEDRDRIRPYAERVARELEKV